MTSPVPGRPSVVYLAVTERCPAACLHCEIWRHGAQARDAPTETWLRWLDRLGEFCAPATVHFVGGEPMQRPDLQRLVERAVLRGMTAGLCTSGWGVTHERARALAAAGLSIAYVSLDGSEAATVDATRGRAGSFEKAMQAIEAFGAQPGVVVVLSSLLHAGNAAQFPALLALARRIGARIMMQTLNQTLGAAPDAAWWLRSTLWPKNGEQIALVETALDALLAARTEAGLVLNTVEQLEGARLFYRDPAGVPALSCPAGSSECGVDAVGDVRLCFYREPIGSLEDPASVESVWQGGAARARRAEVASCRAACRLNTSNIDALVTKGRAAP